MGRVEKVGKYCKKMEKPQELWRGRKSIKNGKITKLEERWLGGRLKRRGRSLR